MPYPGVSLPISIVVAVAKNGVIGAKGDMPWRLPTDLKFFKKTTMGAPMIMGRKTFDAIGRVLPGRLTIIVTSRADYTQEGALIASSIEDALLTAHQWALDNGAGEIFIVGGGDIYKQTLDFADRIYLTEVAAEPEGDTFFPALSEMQWKKVSSENVKAGDQDTADMTFFTLEPA